ncbi:Endophilin-A2 [Madurella mycetomatis]|uniref:Endophilin-A2 n=1 Tax=Madurella mycetomatis TaxID=100816 RepID=A0A175VYZ4_9PEZI|nr:Endophilin-A2 [Madurella mycetomatis]
MNFTKKFDRAFQWAGEKMGAEAKTTMSDDFKMLETEMALRFDGMDRLQRSMNQYVKWIGRHVEASEDKEKGLPVGYLGRTMVNHGEEFQPDSEFGNCLITMGRANERVAAIQDAYVGEATASWLETLERSLAMMKEYQTARKKLENRRLAYDASMSKLQKAKRDDFRLEEELRGAKAKYEESSEDVLRRMQDIQDAEVDNVRGLTQFLDAELDYHERCAEELRRVRNNWAGASTAAAMGGYGGIERRPTNRGRSNTAPRTSIYGVSEFDERETSAPPVRMPPRASTSRAGFSMQPQSQQPDGPARPTFGKANNFQGGASLERERIGGRISGSTTPSSTHSAHQNIPNVGALRGQLRPVSRIVTTRDSLFADRDSDTTSDTGSPDWANRSSSPDTSIGSLSRTSSNSAPVNGNGLGFRKAPPPPPPSRSKKPPPPVPARREISHY